MAQPNGLNPQFARVQVNGITVISGTASTDALIKAEVTGLSAGSLYISIANTTATPIIFVYVVSTWLPWSTLQPF